MSQTAQTTEQEPIQFGNLLSPRLPGLGRLSMPATMFLIVSALVTMILAIFSIWAVLIWVAFSMVLLAPALFPMRDGYGRYEVAWRKLRHSRASSAGETILRQGLVGAVPDGACHLPGIAASTELTSHSDGWGRDFGLLHYPDSDLYACVLMCNPSGFAGLDQDACNGQVAYWAAWLTSLSTVEEIVGMSVVVETVPDSGQRLERAMERGRVGDEGLTDFARDVEEQIHSSSRVASPTLTARLTITLDARVEEELEKGSRIWVRPLEDMASQFADLLPGWTTTLAPTGAGQSVRPATAQEITDATRVAFDPSVAVDVEEAQMAAAAARSAGESGWVALGTGLMWEQAGPIYAESRPDVYVHEGHASRTMQMYLPPSGIFFAESLRPLLEQHKDIERKRVTILYRPETPQASAAEAERQVKAARFKLTQSRHGKAAAEEEYEAARITARQAAKGSPLVRVGMLVTVSASDMTSLRKATRTVRSTLAGAARISLRVPRGSQDYAFLASLPLGVVPHVSARPPRRSRNHVEDARATSVGLGGPDAKESPASTDTLEGLLGDVFNDADLVDAHASEGER